MKEAASAPPCEIGPVGPIAGGSRPAPQPTGEADTQRDRRHVAGCSVDLVLCSTAVRARASAKPVIDALGYAVRYERALPAAGARDLLELVRALPNDVDTVMAVGHNPSLEELTATLCDWSPRYPTAALGTIELLIDHGAHVAPRSGMLTTHVTSTQLQAGRCTLSVE
jgi:phosphohistidine phosphatase SixA